VKNFFWRWLHRLPSQFSSADWKTGYVYELAFRQFEISDTYVFDRQQAGRMWFERVNHDHLDVGQPDQVMLIFDRRLNPLCSGSIPDHLKRRNTLSTAWRQLDGARDNFTDRQLLAA
jgi:hypothetical protein